MNLDDMRVPQRSEDFANALNASLAFPVGSRRDRVKGYNSVQAVLASAIVSGQAMYCNYLQEIVARDSFGVVVMQWGCRDAHGRIPGRTISATILAFDWGGFKNGSVFLTSSPFGQHPREFGRRPAGVPGHGARPVLHVPVVGLEDGRGHGGGHTFCGVRSKAQ